MSPVAATEVPPPAAPDAREIALALLLALGLTVVAAREGRLLTFDGYHYVELAKRFAHEWPDRFGNHWPFGWPLAAGLVARASVPAYWALIGLSIASLVTLLAAAALPLRHHPARWLLLAAVAAAPVLVPQLISGLTELPFAAVLLVLALCLAHWPSRCALWGSAVCAVLALGLRYAGLVALAMLAVNLVARWRALRDAGRLGEALAAWLAASLTSGLLLGWNILKSGQASGAERGHPPGLMALPLELASYGWSLPSALVSGGLRDRIGADSPLGLVIGGACFAAIAGLCVWSWFRPRSDYSRSLALVALGYSAGMGVLHCIGDFDALHNARTFLPALVPLALLLAEWLRTHRGWLCVLCVIPVTAGVVASARGISREIGGDVRPAVAPLRSRLAATDHIAINDYAMSLSAYFPQATDRLHAQHWAERPERAFLVAAGKPADRAGGGATVPGDWVDLAERLVSTGRYRYLVRERGLIALERLRPAPPTP